MSLSAVWRKRVFVVGCGIWVLWNIALIPRYWDFTVRHQLRHRGDGSLERIIDASAAYDPPVAPLYFFLRKLLGDGTIVVPAEDALDRATFAEMAPRAKLRIDPYVSRSQEGVEAALARGPVWETVVWQERRRRRRVFTPVSIIPVDARPTPEYVMARSKDDGIVIMPSDLQ
jgi:hypothetical protein